jgi:hypothetical protein
MGDYNILCGRLFGEKISVEKFIIHYFVARALGIVSSSGLPTFNFFRVHALKKLARTTYEFSFKTDDRKILNRSSAHI